MKSWQKKPAAESQFNVPHGREDDTPTENIDDPSELDEIDLDDQRWEAFLADEDERDPQPGHDDFWHVDE